MNKYHSAWRVTAFAVAVVAAATVGSFAQSSGSRTRIETLASDKFDGRLTGSPGEKLAADYIIDELKRIGAKPLPGIDRKSTRLNSSHIQKSRMPSSA